MINQKKFSAGQLILHIVFILLCACYILPFILVVSVSFTDESVIIQEGYKLFPTKFSTAAYEMIFNNPTQVINSYRTTIIFTAVATFLAILVMGIMAYPMSRRNFKFGKPLAFYVLFTMLFSGGMVPSYLLITRYLHLKNSIWVYILPGLISAYNLIVIRTNYKSLPEELIEAAKLDGASEIFICFKIVMPLCKPVLASIAFLFLVTKWNDWNTAMLYIDDPTLYSLQYMLQKILNEIQFLRQLAQAGMANMEQMKAIPSESFRYAMAMVAAGPVLIVFPFFQKYFAKGMLIGGVKG